MNLTKKREEELLQLLNDVGEDINMSHWSKQDYCDAIAIFEAAESKRNKPIQQISLKGYSGCHCAD